MGLRDWCWTHATGITTVVSGVLSVVCLFVVPTLVFGPNHFDAAYSFQMRGLASVFFLNFALGLVSFHMFVFLGVKRLLPEEWQRSTAE